jgi:hypothetical protein
MLKLGKRHGPLPLWTLLSILLFIGRMLSLYFVGVFGLLTIKLPWREQNSSYQKC